MDDVIYVLPRYPKGVRHIITTGSCHYIGFVDETTILKYSHDEGPSPALEVEHAIFNRLGSHPRIIEFRGKHEEGLLLEYATSGSLQTYIRGDITKEEKLRLARETAEGVAYIHGKDVIICRILHAAPGQGFCRYKDRHLRSRIHHLPYYYWSSTVPAT
ncbi:serine threonine kinase [Pyrenophora seminiperda CCB06]|uniref:Serine threonine kinase n=1 Tax=Pyrenophora seminiperda CCB06 TaxID=1302712 RepID=A0A3M7MAB2_9PLEO|nr:serine threonine kinase [Pyrenophora seminiperda CCB06]